MYTSVSDQDTQGKAVQVERSDGRRRLQITDRHDTSTRDIYHEKRDQREWSSNIHETHSWMND